MYYQVFFYKSNGSISQVSCDNFNEVQQQAERFKTKKVVIEYYNSFGHVGTATKFKRFTTGEYFTARKEKHLN